MRRFLLIVVVLAAAAVFGAVAYQTVARDWEYQRLLSSGDAALADEQTFGAIEAYSGAVALRPDSMLARLRRGETYQRRGDLDAAARDFRAAAGLDPAAPRPHEELGNVLYQMQRYESAAEAYESALRLDDRSARISYKLALARYRAHDIEAAVAVATRGVRLSDSTADAYYLLGLCLRDMQRTADAQHAFEQAIAMSPGFIPAREELADLYAAQNRRVDELDQLQVIAGLDHDHIERQIAVGVAQARAGHAEPAVITLGTALERAPGEPLVYEALGRVWLQDAEARNDRLALNKALEALERVGTGPASTSEALTLYGRALLRDDQLDRAEQTLQQATERYPLDPSAFFYYAAAAERQNHLDAARRALIDYGSLLADDAQFVARVTKIAALSARLNDPASAAHWLQLAVEANPTDVRLIASLGEAQFKAGDRDAARATVARGLDLEPDQPALRALSRRVK
jgi:tetratricopeptide (TPR) repeat protein